MKTELLAAFAKRFKKIDNSISKLSDTISGQQSSITSIEKDIKSDIKKLSDSMPKDTYKELKLYVNDLFRVINGKMSKLQEDIPKDNVEYYNKKFSDVDNTLKKLSQRKLETIVKKEVVEQKFISAQDVLVS